MTRRFVEGYGLMQKAVKTITGDNADSFVSMTAASINIYETILLYQVPKRNILQFLAGEVAGHELWMNLNTVVPAALAAGSLVQIVKLDSAKEYSDTIWEGVYSNFPSAANKSDRNFKVYPQNDVRLNEADYLAVKVAAATAASAADSSVEIKSDRYIPARE